MSSLIIGIAACLTQWMEATLFCMGGGGWVGGWVDEVYRWIEKNEAVGMNYWVLGGEWVGRWGLPGLGGERLREGGEEEGRRKVGGWVDHSYKGGWVGGWVGLTRVGRRETRRGRRGGGERGGAARGGR